MGDRLPHAKDGPLKKYKFAPKIPPRRIPQLVEPKSEKHERDDDLYQELLKRVKEGFAGSGQKTEKKSTPVQVAFGHGGSRTLGRPFGLFKGPGGSGSIQKKPFHDVDNESTLKTAKEYIEPWDHYSYYPVTLPLRRPYSGNPELLNEAEFGEASVVFDETLINSAKELGLTGMDTEQMVLFQLPPSLPLPKGLDSIKSEEMVDGSNNLSRSKVTIQKGCSLEDLPAGFMGKMLVYKSGAIKMKLGDALFDVTPGINSSFAQDIAAINTEEKHCSIVGEITKRSVISPDIDSLLDGIANIK